MHRAVRTTLALAAGLLAFTPALRAQEPPRTAEVKEAEKYLASAMTTQDTVERHSRLQRALTPLLAGAAKDPGNARVWLLLGQAYAGLRDAVHADSSFRKAVQLYPGFGEEVTSLRLGSWADAFNAGVALMDAQKFDDAIAMLENAEIFDATRPESKMNLGALYANKGDAARAEQLFRAAWAIAEGPEKAKLKPEDAANWDRYAGLAKMSVAQMIGQRGIEAFGAEKYDDAVKLFKEAHQLNPIARDYTYNLAQSIYAKASDMEKQRADLVDAATAARNKKDLAGAKAKTAQADSIGKELVSLYTEIEPLTVAAREMDPMNEDLFLLQARSYRTRGELANSAAVKATSMQRVDELLKAHDAMPVEVLNIGIAPATPETAVKGEVKNRKLAAGAPVKLHFTLMSMDGKTVGEQDVTVAAPAVGQSAKFEASIKTSGDVAGWKYAVNQ